LIDVPQDVIDVFESDAQSHEVSGNAGGNELFVIELLMRGTRRMNDQGARIADIREVAEQLHVVDECLCCSEPAVDPEGEHGTGAARRVLQSAIMIAVTG
jgi:hypothetical protein